MIVSDPLPKIQVSDGFNYIGVFLTFRCNYRCSYCINRHSGAIRTSRHLTGAEWVEGLNRLAIKSDLPLTLQGGEPTLHPDFYSIVDGIDRRTNIDLLTNMQFDIDEFKANVSPDRIRRNAPYASIRVSYHPETMDRERTLEKARRLQQAGYSVGLFGVLHPLQEDRILDAQQRASDLELDFRTKEFLGYHEGRLYGRYRYPEAVRGGRHRPVWCRNSEILIDPSGFVYRCHHDVYHGVNAMGHLLDPDWRIESRYRRCRFFGRCNPCDIKLKNNRFQQFGHCSVEILGATEGEYDEQTAYLPDQSAVSVAD